MKMKSLKTNKPNNKLLKRTGIVVFALLVALIAVSAFALFNHSPKESDQATTRPTNSVDYSGPTDEEEASGDSQKEANKEREALDALPPANKAEIIVTDASQYNATIEVRAFSSNVYEDTGTCTATFSLAGSPDVTVQQKAFKDATTTQCGALDASRSTFARAGTWKVTVSYSSPTAQGSSQQQEVIIK